MDGLEKDAEEEIKNMLEEMEEFFAPMIEILDPFINPELPSTEEEAAPVDPKAAGGKAAPPKKDDKKAAAKGGKGAAGFSFVVCFLAWTGTALGNFSRILF